MSDEETPTYKFYYVPLETPTGPEDVPYEVSEVSAAEKYLGKFLEEFRET